MNVVATGQNIENINECQKINRIYSRIQEGKVQREKKMFNDI